MRGEGVCECVDVAVLVCEGVCEGVRVTGSVYKMCEDVGECVCEVVVLSY